MGLAGLAGWQRRGAFFRRAIAEYEIAKRGDDTWLSIQFMKTMKVDRVAARLLLNAVDDTPEEELARITMPTMVLCGEKDSDNGSAPRLAEVLPDAEYVAIPGTHMSSVAEGAMGDALVEFLQ